MCTQNGHLISFKVKELFQVNNLRTLGRCKFSCQFHDILLFQGLRMSVGVIGQILSKEVFVSLDGIEAILVITGQFPAV